jgi:hypothetical protein
VVADERDAAGPLDPYAGRTEAADVALENAAALGLGVHAMTEQLQADAHTAFNSSFNQLLATLAEKRRRNLTAAS